ncbi:hypothetical protein M409DRAFT_18852 [Zasmidium cellare ATCC 36951]|uniref:Enoyl reductase (ER) domain-containing protein n=1 Tax=Zasmidium cellare ATCC 36951 TaxID=1080233 RepID=A0A6A6CXE2_ZASCE|nr:uncharacterized protein M409DRAFT_18852 [Zasmidium cellare ATCC 36951]KAF2170880.1 hypothetical protein M409DRAFT_18852 [Zasmidium cellare ATCC 36951]
MATSNPITFPFATEAYIARPNAPSPPVLEPITYSALQPTEVLVSIAAVSICHTDLRAISGDFHLKPPMIPGHEGSGTVLATGSQVTYVEAGDSVVLAYASCGRCRRCVLGKNAFCDGLVGMNFAGSGDGVVRDGDGGHVKGGFFGQSSMSRVALVHESSCVKVDVEDKRELELCASLGCGIQTGAGSILNIAKPTPSSKIVIFGAGAVGLSALLAAKLTSPSHLILIDKSPTKLSNIHPSLLTNVHVLDTSTHKTPTETALAIKALTPGNMGVDYALECIGNESCILAAHACLDTLGTLITVGSSATAKLNIGIGTHLIRGITIRGTHQGDSVSRVMVPELVGLWKRGVFPFELVVERFGFGELGRAVGEMRSGRVVKPLLVA